MRANPLPGSDEFELASRSNGEDHLPLPFCETGLTLVMGPECGRWEAQMLTVFWHLLYRICQKTQVEFRTHSSSGFRAGKQFHHIRVGDHDVRIALQGVEVMMREALADFGRR